jgi:thioredoxin reductase
LLFQQQGLHDDHPGAHSGDMSDTWDVVVVGGGSAGLSAALMLTRARRRVVVLDGGQPRNRFAPHMHAVLGHDGIPPTELLARGRSEIESYGGVIVAADVLSAARTDGGFEIVATDGARFVGRRLLVATGLRDELPPVPGLAEQWGRGVVSCPYCDGYEVRDQRIGVLAGGPGRAPYAQLIRQWSSSVVFLTNGETPDAADRAELEARGIRVVETPVVGVRSTEGVLTGVALADGTVVELDVIFAMPQPTPRDEVLRGLGAASANGFVTVDEQGLTSVEGVWAAGNVVNPRANVPVSMGAGSSAGGAINYDLVLEDVRLAMAASLQVQA